MPGPMLLQPCVAITAGARVDGAYAELAGTRVKALAPVRGSTMLDRTLTAALEIAGADRIAVVGGPEVRAVCEARGVRSIEERDRGGDNVRLALSAWPCDAPLLYLTSDMPYVSGPALRRFVEAVPADTVAMPICTYAAFAKRFSGAPPFGVTLDGERVVNGGAFLVPAGARDAVADLSGAFFDARKSPVRMASLVGASALARLFFKRLSIASIERRACRVLKHRTVAVRDSAPELAFDADTAAEYAYACAHD